MGPVDLRCFGKHLRGISCIFFPMEPTTDCVEHYNWIVDNGGLYRRSQICNQSAQQIADSQLRPEQMPVGRDSENLDTKPEDQRRVKKPTPALKATTPLLN